MTAPERPSWSAVVPARRVLGLVGTRSEVLAALSRLEGLTWDTLGDALTDPRPRALAA